MLAQVGAHGVWKLTQPWTHRTRPPLLAKRADAFRTAPTTRHQVSLLRRRTKDKNSFRPQPQSPTDSAEEAYYVKLTTPSGNLVGTSIGSGNDTPVHVTSGSFDACYRLSAILIKATDATPGYDTTTNQGGEYKVWVSRDSDFASKKTDNFKVKSSEVNCDEHPSDPACLVAQGELKVVKYYDASTDGTHATISEPDILSWEVRIDGPNLAADFELTTVDKFVEPGDYKVEESTPLEANWIHTTATVVNPATVTNGGTTLVEFGNVCVGAGGGLTLGFWSNKNGEAAMKDGGSLAPELL